MTSGSLWNYFRDEVNNEDNRNDDNHNTINNNKRATSKCFEYKTKIIGTMPNNNNILDAEVVVPLNLQWQIWDILQRVSSLDVYQHVLERHIIWDIKGWTRLFEIFFGNFQVF